jgi:hypothetical protein
MSLLTTKEKKLLLLIMAQRLEAFEAQHDLQSDTKDLEATPSPPECPPQIGEIIDKGKLMSTKQTLTKVKHFRKKSEASQ